MVLNAIYEEDFLGFSYGFRPGRGPHDASDALATATSSRTVNFILDAALVDKAIFLASRYRFAIFCIVFQYENSHYRAPTA
jgi:hypothetical protein